MTVDSNQPQVLFIVGPTASGKTSAALALAERLPIEIVNGDSRQIYRHMSIGTAKPSPAELASAPHRLFDIADPDHPFSLAVYLDYAHEAIREAWGTGRLPVVVGGTSQYIWALVEGWHVPRVKPQAEFRAQLEEEAQRSGPDELHARLRRVDIDAANAIDPRNIRRVIRALEVYEATGQRFSSQRKRTVPSFRTHVMGISYPRVVLHQRVAERVDRMLADGWVGEVSTLLGMGYTPELPSFSSAGYREIAAYLSGQLSLSDATAQARIAHRRLVRRQGSGFRVGDKRIAWHQNQLVLIENAERAVSS